MSEEKNNDNIIVDIEKYDEEVNNGKVNDGKVEYVKVNEDNSWLTNKYKVTVTDGDKKNSYIIADKSAYNVAINYIENDIHHGVNTSFDKKYTITEYDNKKNKKTSKQQTFMFHYNPNSINANGTNSDVKTEQKNNILNEQKNNILNVLDKSGFCKLKGRKININDKTKKKEEQTLNNFQIYEDKQYSIYSMNNFLSRIALKTKQIGRWFSDAWTSLKWRFKVQNTRAETNLNDANTSKSANIST